MTEIPELTPEQLARGIKASVRKRLMRGEFESGEEVAALRRLEGPAVALLRIAARHPGIIRESLTAAGSAA